MISVTVSSPDLDIAEQWDSLSQKAANVFMNPVALKAASETMLAVISVLLAWDIGMEPSKLVGIWAVQAKNILPWWPAFAEAHNNLGNLYRVREKAEASLQAYEQAIRLRPT